MKLRRFEPVERYVGALSVVGLTIGAWIVAHGATAEIHTATPAVAILMVLVVVGELYPIRVPLRDDAGEVTTSPAFVFALLLLSGPALAVIAQTFAALVVRRQEPQGLVEGDVQRRAVRALDRGRWSALIGAISPNFGFDGASGLAAHDFVATVRGGHGIRSSSTTSSSSSRSRSPQRVPVAREFRNNLGFHTATTLVLIAQGPLIALAASRSLVWVLLFVPGILRGLPDRERFRSPRSSSRRTTRSPVCRTGCCSATGSGG